MNTRQGYAGIHWLSALIAGTILFICTGLRAQNPTEYEVKAVYIYNFVNFVEWPESTFKQASSAFVIGIAGQNVFGNSLHEVVNGENYRGRRIEVRHITDAGQASDCQVIYIEKSCPVLQQILSNTKGKPVLTIADTDNFMQDGGTIRFFMEQNKVKIEVNEQAVQIQQLQMSSKLLRLARIYKK